MTAPRPFLVRSTLLALVPHPPPRPAPAIAQQPTPYRPEALSAEDYARARAVPRDQHGSARAGGVGCARPGSDGGDRFLVPRNNDFAEGAEFVLVETPSRRTARGRSTTKPSPGGSPPPPGGKCVRSHSRSRASISWTEGSRWRSTRCGTCATRRGAVHGVRRPARRPAATRSSRPTARWPRSCRENNLWVKDVCDGAETQLTFDGIPDFGYATDNAGWTKSDAPSCGGHLIRARSRRSSTTPAASGTWTRGHGGGPSAASRCGSTRSRGLGDLPHLRVVVHLDGPRVVRRLRMPPDQHRSTICDHISCGGTFADVEWSDDSRQLAFVSSSRTTRRRACAWPTPRPARSTTSWTSARRRFFESGVDMINWHVLDRSGRVLCGRGATTGTPVPLRPGDGKA